MITEAELQPGDVLLYKGKGVWMLWTRWKTWSKVGHVEVYVGNGRTITASPSKGVNYHPLRLSEEEGLRYVLRSKATIDVGAGLAWFEANVRGQRYDLLGLVKAFYLNRDGAEDKMWCSEIVGEFLRACRAYPFADDLHADSLAPAQFLQTNDLWKVWSYK